MLGEEKKSHVYAVTQLRRTREGGILHMNKEILELLIQQILQTSSFIGAKQVSTYMVAEGIKY